jgi:stage II sporulation SpoAA-like protein
MPIIWKHESKDFLVARVNSKLAKPEIEEFQVSVGPLIQASGNCKFLVILENFEGWEASEDWADTSFSDENDQFLSRFAIVGDEKWRDKALMFSLAGLRPVDIQYFSYDQENAARKWLAEG